MFTLILENEVKARYVRFTYNIDGNFCWSSEAAVYGNKPTDAPVTRGDVNADGEINATDYMMLKRTILGTYALTPAQLANADVDGDGALKLRDYMMLKRYILGTFELPA